ncbi:hypothetical protein [Chryseobacterium sp. G0162]|uniref:hypothetical protein n=1 Tax=Chryseobacterium sp. G0162 TaxID=2487063 RepID=UPI000F4FA455|nr:hypothetical protein [Chryseobacterium sp. G0162]
MDLKISTYFILILIFVLISCEKHQKLYSNPISSFQNLICDDPINDSTKIKNVETFLIFGNSTDDTIKVSLRDIQKNYKHIYEKDTFEINFEALNPISIPPHDSLGLPCMSVIEKKFANGNEIFKDGFSVLNLKTKKAISETSNYSLEQVYEFQMYQKWGKKSGKINL